MVFGAGGAANNGAAGDENDLCMAVWRWVGFGAGGATVDCERHNRPKLVLFLLGAVAGQCSYIPDACTAVY